METPVTCTTWPDIINWFSQKYGEGIDLTGILFLIGIQELGKGRERFEKNEKLDLIHIAICRMLEPLGYYEYTGKDRDGWPHWKPLKQLPALNPQEQELFIKDAVLKYFSKTHTGNN